MAACLVAVTLAGLTCHGTPVLPGRAYVFIGPGARITVPVSDRGYPNHCFRDHNRSTGARPAMPAKRDETPVACPGRIYNDRNGVKRLWARFERWRALAIRYEKTAMSFTASSASLRHPIDSSDDRTRFYVAFVHVAPIDTAYDSTTCFDAHPDTDSPL